MWKPGGKSGLALEVCSLLCHIALIDEFHLFAWQFTCYHGCGKTSVALTIRDLLYS